VSLELPGFERLSWWMMGGGGERKPRMPIVPRLYFVGTGSHCDCSLSIGIMSGSCSPWPLHVDVVVCVGAQELAEAQVLSISILVHLSLDISMGLWGSLFNLPAIDSFAKKSWVHTVRGVDDW